MIIGITDPMRDAATYEMYGALVRKWIPGAEVQILSCVTGTFSEIERCDALLLTGGGDVHPKFYGREEDAAFAREVKIGRDMFEFDIIREAIERGMPVLGICRGAQVLNVALGGTLHQHLPDVIGHIRHQQGNAEFYTSTVRTVAGSRLAGLIGETSDAQCYHHQAIDRLGDGLMVSARDADGVIEAVEMRGDDFVLAVQWHPEETLDDLRLFAGVVQAARAYSTGVGAFSD